jgi:hypothetical protein
VEGRDELCEITPVSFQGCPCSDAAGQQLCYSQIMEEIRRGRGSGGGSAASAAAGGGIRTGPQPWAAGNAQQGAGGQPGDTGSTRRGGQRGLAQGAGNLREDAGNLREEDDIACEDPKMDPTQGSLYTRCHANSEPNKHTLQVMRGRVRELHSWGAPGVMGPIRAAEGMGPVLNLGGQGPGRLMCPF